MERLIEANKKEPVEMVAHFHGLRLGREVRMPAITRLARDSMDVSAPATVARGHDPRMTQKVGRFQALARGPNATVSGGRFPGAPGITAVVIPFSQPTGRRRHRKM